MPAVPGADRDRLSHPFDHYQRFEPVRVLLERFRSERGGGPLSIIDVGGANGPLRQFLPGDRVAVVDLSRKGAPDVIARGEALPFGSGAADVAVSIDTLEHVPAAARRGLLAELSRVARDLVVVAAPFDDPAVRAAEDHVEQTHVALYGKVDAWLVEHEECGLPVLADTTRALAGAFDAVRVVPNGYLPFWRYTMALNYLILSLPESHDLYRRVNEHVNETYYAISNREPSYRKVLIAARRDGAWIDAAVAEMAPAGGDPHAAFEALQAECTGLLGRALAGSLEAKLELVRVLEAHIVELQGFVSELRAGMAAKETEIETGKSFAEHLGREHDVLSAEYAVAKAHVVKLEGYIRQIEAEFAEADKLINQFGVEKELLKIQNAELAAQARASAQEIQAKDRLIQELQARFGLAGLRRLLSPGSGGAR